MSATANGYGRGAADAAAQAAPADANATAPGIKREVTYVDVAAWRLVGGPLLAADAGDIELDAGPNHRVALTANPNPWLTHVDRGLAIRGQLLVRRDHEAIDAAFRALQDERISPPGVFLVVKATGRALATLPAEPHRIAGDIVVWDAVDAPALRQAHWPLHRAARAAVALDGPQAPRFTRAGSGLHLLDDDLTPIHSLRLRMGGTLVTSRELSAGAVEQIRARLMRFRSNRALESVGRLVSRMLESHDDPLRTFLAGWTALEILFGKAFKALGLTAAPKTCRGCQTTTGAPPNLLDMFTPVAKVLLPTQSPETLAADEETLRTLKSTRNAFMHGDEVPEDTLPLHALAMLLRKYARAFADAVAP